MKKVLLLISLSFLGSIIFFPILFYGIGDIIRIWNRVHIKDEFYIEYSEAHISMSLRNGPQGFVRDVKEAYWNNDSLIVSGNNGCFLIEFGKTKYNDEMLEIGCGGLNQILKNKPIEKYLREK